MKFLATCNPGLEEISIREIFELTGRKGETHHKGAVVFEGKEDDLFKLNYLSRSLHRIILLLKSGTFEKLDDLYKEIKEIDFSEYIYPTQSFAIRPERVGEHDFTSIDIGRVAGQAVIDSYKESKGVRLKVNLNNPNIIVRVEVRENKFWVGLDTTGEESLHKRWYRKFSSKAPLKSTIAYSMVRIAGLDEKEGMIDPFCGCGTIPIEAYLWLSNIPPNQKRNFDFTKFVFINRQNFLEFLKSMRVERREDLKIFGSDISKKEINFAKENAKEAGAVVNFFIGDACKIDLNYDKIITDLPYGIRTSSKNLDKIYRCFFDNLRNFSWKKVVFITAKIRENLIPLPLESFEKIYDVNYGDIKARIYVLSKL